MRIVSCSVSGSFGDTNTFRRGFNEVDSEGYELKPTGTLDR
jgi:hypothetical protein